MRNDAHLALFFAILLAFDSAFAAQMEAVAGKRQAAHQKIIRRSPLGDEFRRVPGEQLSHPFGLHRRYPWKTRIVNNCLFDR